MRLLLLLLLGIGSALSAQSIDAGRSRFLTTPNGRTGCYAPFRLVLESLAGNDTVTVRSVSRGVVLEQQVAVAGREAVDVVLPVLVAEGVSVEVQGVSHDTLTPQLPVRRVEPDYARPYVAVFSTDPLYARGVLPSVPGTAVCDYFELSEFFTDWRLLDGYDAIVIFNPSEARMPPGSQRAIAEFCSLGGAALVAGTFQLGEKAVGLPAPADPQIMTFRDVQGQRFGYGPGAIYRFSAEDLRRSRSAQSVLIDALLDHAWYGAGKAPAGSPESRIPPPRTPFAPPLPAVDATPGPLFWGLAGGLLLLCLLAPVISGRYLKPVWPAQLALTLLVSAIGASAMLQQRPLPTVEASALVRQGGGEATSARVFLIGAETWRDSLTVDLGDAQDRSLPRVLSSRPGWNAWLIDLPLLSPSGETGASVSLNFGMVGEDSYRDFATRARRGLTEFSTSEAFLLEWWLEANAYRGRRATIMPREWPDGAVRFDDARLVIRGAISVTAQREAG